MPKVKKFVILSDSRSGTSLLSETLNSHPQIVCHGEVFHPTPTGHIKISEDEIATADLVSLREANADQFLDIIYSPQGAKAVGFKMWRSQKIDMCDKLMEDESVAKIIYERTNVLARFASSRLVKASGIYNLKPGATRPDKLNSKITFDATDFEKYAKRHTEIFSVYRAKSKGPVLDITYKSIVEKGFEEVLSFLDVDRVALSHQKEKLHSSCIIERFAERDQAGIVSLVKTLGYPEWLTE